ncbi:hypothetical protein AMK59_5595 [Oryctes borbonicus]|uniref:Uncharacterized protein n=1 Tax=Oryctes borbonicus TaxID=1629725 RepID=A0A0T6B320_9SCAR|nr:hypothetical protein AMK59_5595 [Oryctes borbonicus]
MFKSTMNFLLCSIIFSTFLSITASVHAHNRCKSEKLAKCVCGNVYYVETPYYMVNCTNTGFTDASMLREIPFDTEAVLFTGNRVESLPENIFGEEKNFTKLRLIDMSNNGIRDIPGKTFHHVPNVEMLILNHNNIKISYDEDKTYHHPRVFSNFINLRELHLTNAFADNTDEQLANDLHDIFDKSHLTNVFRLHLEQNEIRYFKDTKVFCNLPSLTQLYLGNNLISHVDFESFKCLKLQFLDLQNNSITELSNTDLEALDALEDIAMKERTMSVDLNGNPLKCSTSLNFHNWLQKTNVVIRHEKELQCYVTIGNMRRAVNLNTIGETKRAKLSNAITVLLVTLGLVLVSLVAAYGYLNRARLRNRMSPILDVVSRKVQYTTIESQIV